MPGDPEWLLSDEEPLVTCRNVESYCNAVLEQFFVAGVRRQLRAFARGFSAVFALSHLRVFTVGELEQLLCGDGVDPAAWTREALAESVQPAHGFTHESATFQHLIDVLADDFDAQLRRDFLQFATGSPRLPPGGFAALEPRLTVVRKEESSALPTVSACLHYLKIPDYRDRDELRTKLVMAVKEGQGEFLLS